MAESIWTFSRKLLKSAHLPAHMHEDVTVQYTPFVNCICVYKIRCVDVAVNPYLGHFKKS